MATIYRLRIASWERFNPRSDQKTTKWCRLEAKFIFDPEFTGDSALRLTWIAVMNLRTAAGESEEFELSIEDVAYHMGLSVADVESSITYLIDSSKLISISRRARIRTNTIGSARVRAETCSTEQDRTEQDKTTREVELPIVESEPAGAQAPLVDAAAPTRLPSPQALADLWNSTRRLDLPKVTKLKATSTRWKSAKARLADEPDLDYWRKTIERLNQSAFCCGQNDRGWTASFDWLIKPETHLKLSEGRYDTRKPTNHNEPSRPKLELVTTEELERLGSA